MIVNMLLNYSHMYFSHHRIIKCVDFESIHHKIIECVDFESIHCTINLNVASSSRVFSEFDCVSNQMY